VPVEEEEGEEEEEDRFLGSLNVMFGRYLVFFAGLTSRKAIFRTS